MYNIRAFRIALLVSAALAAASGAPPFAAASAAPPASIYFTVPASPVPAGGTFSVAVMVDSSQPLNAYAIRVDYLADGGVSFLGANNAHSIISVWQGMPPPAPAAASGTVTFAGGSIAPFKGTGGELMTLNFAAVATGTVELSFGTSRVYLANGKGTEVLPQASGAAVQISRPAEGGVTGIVGAPPAVAGLGNATDTTAPVVSYAAFAPDPFNGNQKLFAFQAGDAGSGVKGTEIRYRSGVTWSAWEPAENPAPLANGVWEVDLRVADNAGNIAERTFIDKGALERMITLIALGLAAAAATFWWFLRRRRTAGARNGSART